MLKLCQDVKMKYLILILLLISCANLTESGAKVGFIETTGRGLEVMEFAEKISANHGCKFMGFIEARTSLFPPSYSIHQNEVHAALRNRAAKIGANVIVANFYEKPARGVGLLCPEEFVRSNDDF